MSEGESGIGSKFRVSEVSKSVPRITEISPNVKVEGFGENEASIRRLVESVGLPLDNVPEIKLREFGANRSYSSIDKETGQMTFFGDFVDLPEISQLGLVAHDLARENSPFKSKNFELFGSEKNIQRAAENVKRVASQTKETRIFMDPQLEDFFERLEDGKIDENEFLEETNALMVELRYTNPEHLKNVLGKQNKKTSKKIFNELDKTLLNLIPHIKSKGELERHIDNLHSSFATDLKTQENEKKPFDVRIGLAAKKVLSSPERAVELFSAFAMQGLELVHDMQLYPAKYRMTQDQAGRYLIPDNPPAAKWAMDHIGDIWEISVGHAALRIGFVAVNEILKKEPIKELTKGYQISDEACFWASLTTIVTVKAIHSLGYISLFGIHDHMDHPVPGMLFGQGVAAVVLVASHYTAKYREPIKNLALRVGKGFVKGAKFADKKRKEIGQKLENLGSSDIAPDV